MNGDKDRTKLQIAVNGRRRIVSSRYLTFDEVVHLAFDPPPSGPYIEFDVTYRNAVGRPSDGVLAPGQRIEIQEGTVFNVTATDKS